MKISERNKHSLVPALGITGVLTTLFTGIYFYNMYLQVKERNQQLRIEDQKSQVRREINNAFHLPGINWPSTIYVSERPFKVEYTFNEDLTDYIKRLLVHFRSDYSTIVVIDNNTGAVLAAVGHERATDKFNKNLAFSSTHPAASLIKIVVTADLLERGAVDRTTSFRHRGRGTTLYRSQLENTNSGRAVSFGRAFAFSNNVVFGQAAIQRSSGEKLYRMANEFGFNKRLMQVIDLSESQFDIAQDSFNLAELASGFNRETMMSPIHATVLSLIAANDGKMYSPYIVDRVYDDRGELFWDINPKSRQVLSLESTRELQDMMEMTVLSGTARRHFDTMRHGLRPHLFIGGKTGSITGGVPFGRRDWFTAFAIPRDEGFGKGISVAAMNINLEKWYVRSTHLTKRVIEYYYKNVFPLDESNQFLEGRSSLVETYGVD